MKLKALSLAIGATISGAAFAEPDFGQLVERALREESRDLFGVNAPLKASSSASVTAATAGADATTLVTLAKGLTARVVSDAPGLGAIIDQMVLWPNAENPTHLIACNEDFAGASGIGLQRVEIATGAVETIVGSGLLACDGIRHTPWGTLLIGEEAGAGGRWFELIDPLHTTGVTVSGSGAATTTNSPNFAYRPALGHLSSEGLAVLPNGVVYYGDENRPGNGNPGGAYFKFIPSTLWTAGSAPITDLASSPLTSGSIYGMRIGKRSNNTDYGQGNEYGRGVWVPVTGTAPIALRTEARNLKLTSYYRPEDMDIDLKALAAGKVRLVANNTGDDTPGGDNHWGEVVVITDGTVAEAGNTATLSTPELQPLKIGNKDFAMVDNVAYQPGRGNWLIQEDGEGPIDNPPRNNDIFSCLDDGADIDQFSDGCVKVISLNDLTAESTGGIFNATGKRYFLSVQHNITGHGVILEIDGWK